MTRARPTQRKDPCLDHKAFCGMRTAVEEAVGSLLWFFHAYSKRCSTRCILTTYEDDYIACVVPKENNE